MDDGCWAPIPGKTVSRKSEVWLGLAGARIALLIMYIVLMPRNRGFAGLTTLLYPSLKAVEWLRNPEGVMDRHVGEVRQ